jgi:hypothetical protein
MEDFLKEQKQDEHSNEIVAKNKTLKNCILQKGRLFLKTVSQRNLVLPAVLMDILINSNTTAYLDYMPP